MTIIKSLIICVLSLICLTGFGKKYSLEQKIDLLYEAMPGSTAPKFKKELNFFIHELAIYNSQSPAKRVKKIYTLTKKKYLENYYLYAFFPELLTEGHFNCVTGTALFAIIFDELEIPYSIVEVPQHVYLVAYPDSYKIGVESTSEKNGVYVWTEHTKIEAVSFLISIDKVTQEEVRLKGIDLIIEEYFYTNEELDFDGIVALHLINRSLYLSDKKKYKDALACLKRARQLYQSPTLDMIEGSVLSELMSTTEIENIDMVDYLTRYYSICGTKPERQRTLKNFDYIVNEALITRRDIAFIDSTESLVKLNLEEEDQNLFLAIIEESKSIWHYNRGKYEEALVAAELSYKLNPKNRNTEDLIASSLINSITDSDMEDEEVGELVLTYVEKYPFLHESPQFVNFEIAVYAVLAGDSYFYNKVTKANLYFELMQSLLTNTELDLEEVSEYLAEAYSQYAAYLFRNAMYAEALKWINLAIEYDPESEGHQEKRDYILTKN